MSEIITTKIYGKFITNHYRTMVLSQEWQQAVNSLGNIFNENTNKEKIVLDILSGRKKIDGFAEINGEGLFVTDDLDEEDHNYVKQLNYIYNKNIFTVGDDFYRLRKIVILPNYLTENEIDEINVSELDDICSKIKEIDQENDSLYFNCEVFSYNDMIYVFAEHKDKNFSPIWLRKDDFSLDTLIEENKQENEELRLTLEAMELFKINEQNIAKVGIKPMNFNDKILAIQIHKQIIKQKIQCVEVMVEHNDEKLKLNVPILLLKKYFDRSIYYSSKAVIKEEQWSTVCPSGLKMIGDSAVHSDLWLALGFDLDNAYYTKEEEFFNDLKRKYMRDCLGLNKIVLLNKIDMLMNSNFTGPIKTENSSIITEHDILVLPNANLEYTNLAKKAGAVIVESGTQLSHIAIKGKDEFLPVVLFPEALSKLKEGENITLDFKNQEIIKM